MKTVFAILYRMIAAIMALGIIFGFACMYWLISTSMAAHSEAPWAVGGMLTIITIVFVLKPAYKASTSLWEMLQDVASEEIESF